MKLMVVNVVIIILKLNEYLRPDYGANFLQ